MRQTHKYHSFVSRVGVELYLIESFESLLQFLNSRFAAFRFLRERFTIKNVFIFLFLHLILFYPLPYTYRAIIFCAAVFIRCVKTIRKRKTTFLFWCLHQKSQVAKSDSHFLMTGCKIILQVELFCLIKSKLKWKLLN